MEHPVKVIYLLAHTGYPGALILLHLMSFHALFYKLMIYEIYFTSMLYLRPVVRGTAKTAMAVPKCWGI